MSPQKENGYVAIANELFEAFYRCKLLEYERVVVMCVWRKTYGWNKKDDRIALSQIANETGINRSNVGRTISQLEKKNIIKKNGSRRYVNKMYMEWKVEWRVVSHQIAGGISSDTKGGISSDTYKRQYKYINTKDRGVGSNPQPQLGEKEKDNIIKSMYNYEPVDENGNPKKKKISRITKDENNMLISVGHLWREMCAKALKLDESEVVMNNIYYAIRKCYDREKFKKEDFKELFKYFFESKINEEDKLSFDLCLSQKYVAKFKLSRKIKSKKFNNVSVSSDIKL